MMNATSAATLARIAREVLAIEVLTVRGRDALDFRDCRVGAIRWALERAYAAGAVATARAIVRRATTNTKEPT